MQKEVLEASQHGHTQRFPLGKQFLFSFLFCSGLEPFSRFP